MQVWECRKGGGSEPASHPDRVPGIASVVHA
jgi:hypothetical protein